MPWWVWLAFAVSVALNIVIVRRECRRMVARMKY